MPLAVFAATLVYFGLELSAEPFFADESANLTQTYYWRLLASGDVHNADWLHPAAYDHFPLLKYLYGATLSAGGRADQIPTSLRPWEQWMGGRFDPPSDDAVLWQPRVTTMTLAALGCALAYVFGRQLIGPKTGLMAAYFLATGPLFFRHARRAMHDDVVITFILAAFVGAVAMLHECQRDHFRWIRFTIVSIISGAACALAALTKLNGAVAVIGIALLAVGCLATFRPPAPEDPPPRRFGLAVTGFALIGIVAAGLFVGLNPYLWAQPKLPDAADATIMVDGVPRSSDWLAECRKLKGMSIPGRLRYAVVHRTQSLAAARKTFPHLATPTLSDRVAAMIDNGLGRWFSGGAGYPEPHDENPAPSPRQHGVSFHAPARMWGVLILILAFGGLVQSWRLGRQQTVIGRYPVGWLAAMWFLLEAGILLRGLAVNFDRYHTGLAASASVLVALGVGATFVSVTRRLILNPNTPEDLT